MLEDELMTQDSILVVSFCLCVHVQNECVFWFTTSLSFAFSTVLQHNHIYFKIRTGIMFKNEVNWQAGKQEICPKFDSDYLLGVKITTVKVQHREHAQISLQYPDEMSVSRVT